jgi:hypothetical protein
MHFLPASDFFKSGFKSQKFVPNEREREKLTWQKS